VILGVDGVSDFNALHSGTRGAEVQLRAFDALAVDGEDPRDCRCRCVFHPTSHRSQPPASRFQTCTPIALH
jgi:hypothetical protein